MKDNDLIWRFIDGDCDEAEQAAILKRLEEDTTFKQALEESQHLDKAFVELELEQPSMRFTTNVMENLPTLYEQLPTLHLLGPGWIKAFWAGLSFMLVSTIGVGLFSPDATQLTTGNGTAGWFEKLLQFSELPFMSYKSAVILFAVSTSSVFLLWLDRQIAKQRKRT